jgi:hypothetical protein
MTRNVAYYGRRGFHETSRETELDGRVFMAKVL